MKQVLCLIQGAKCSDTTVSGMTCAPAGADCKCSGTQAVQNKPDGTVSCAIDGSDLVLGQNGVKKKNPFCSDGKKMVIKAKIPQGSKGDLTYYEIWLKQ